MTGPLLRVVFCSPISISPRAFLYPRPVPQHFIPFALSLLAPLFGPPLLRFVDFGHLGSSNRITLSLRLPPFFLHPSTPSSSLPPHASHRTSLHDLIKHRRLDCHSTVHSEQSQNARRVSPCLPFSVGRGWPHVPSPRRESNPQDLKKLLLTYPLSS